MRIYEFSFLPEMAGLPEETVFLLKNIECSCMYIFCCALALVIVQFVWAIYLISYGYQIDKKLTLNIFILNDN